MRNTELRTWIEIDKSALEHNFNVFKSIISKKCLLGAVVKSNAYGHGLVEASEAFDSFGADWLMVDSVLEAYTLRENGLKMPILVLGYAMPYSFIKAEKLNISLTISSLNSLKAVPKNSKLKIHIKIDTGMHRQGFDLKDIPAVIKYIGESLPGVKIEGIYSHFAAAKNPSFPKETFAQAKIFEQSVNVFKQNGFDPLKHICASSGTLIYPQFHYDLVRVGISLYGYWPSVEVEYYLKDKIKLRPALHWKSIISEVKALPAKSMIGYDFTESVDVKTRVGIVPIGYWHGFPRSLSSIGRIGFKNKTGKILGRVCMDMVMLNLNQFADVKSGDEITILGESIPIAEFSRLSTQSEYEVITTINPLIKRIYI